MTTEPVIFINCFEVPKGREDEFFAHWSEVNTYMKRKPGFVSNRLHRAKTPNARIRICGCDSRPRSGPRSRPFAPTCIIPLP